MKSIVLLALLFLAQSLTAQSVKKIDYFFSTENYNPDIPKPADVFGFEVGEWHLRHDQILRYMEILAEKSDRVTLREYGRTYEQRRLVALTITSPENHANLETIKKEHVSLSNPVESGNANLENMPIVLYMGFSVHGNEPSGANSSVLTAYRLAASNEPEILDALNKSVIIFDPAFNPDGLDRFAFWANTNRGNVLVSDRQSREHNEYWPRGRANHYWFDLNRDWLPVQHTEMVGRIALFHEWKPNILTDHHEMGTDATFFFQPGIPSRTNPITPKKNQVLTGKLGEFHAKAFDSRNALYYSKESYDDFYYGKGSTYPDVNGAIGILFEQASSRGHIQESIHGDLAFSFTIKNQVEAAFSTLRGSIAMKSDFLTYQRDFYKEALNEGKKSSVKGFVFGDEHDRYKTLALVKMLRHHQIEIQELNADAKVGKTDFKAKSSYFVPSEQAQYRLVRAIFETQTTFEDSLFYDVSSWTMPLAFNLPYEEVSGKEISKLKTKKVESEPIIMGSVVESAKSVAYVFETSEYFSHRAIYQLQEMGIRVKVNTEPFSASVKGSVMKFDYGSAIISIGGQDVSESVIKKALNEVALTNFLTIYGLETGATAEGVDVGSRSHELVSKPSVLLITGDGVTSTDAGELWHLLDTRMHIPTVLMDVDQIGNAELYKYNVILMPGGWYSGLGKSGAENLSKWVSDGGTLIAMKGALSVLASHGIAAVKFEKSTKQDSSKSLAYADYSNMTGAQQIGGAIFETKLDRTHPLAYGIKSNTLPVFRDHELFMKPSSNPFANPFMYTGKPLLSGYISGPNLKKLSGTAAVSVYGKGSGQVIALLDNPNFRAFWYGPNKVLMNAIFFGNTITRGTKGK